MCRIRTKSLGLLLHNKHRIRKKTLREIKRENEEKMLRLFAFDKRQIHIQTTRRERDVIRLFSPEKCIIAIEMNDAITDRQILHTRKNNIIKR